MGITWIDRGAHPIFQRLLYDVATAGLSPADIAWSIRSLSGPAQHTSVVGNEVLGDVSKSSEDET